MTSTQTRANVASCILPSVAPEFAFHEPHIRLQKWEPQFLAGFGVGSCHHPADVSKTDKAVEIGDRARLRIDWIAKSHGGRPKNVIKTAESRRSAGDRNRGK